MHEHRGLASPSYDSEHSGSKRLRAHDLYQGSNEKYASPGSDLRYDRIKESENEISGHIDKVSKFQNERLAEELKTNAYYKRELDALRSNLHSTGSKVKSNHFPQDDEDYLIKSTKERIRRLQEQRERELVDYQFEEDSAEKAKVRSRQSHREEELYKDLYPKEGEFRESNRFKESVTSYKTYDLSQSTKSPSAQYKERITGGLRSLEEKMDVMEKELDQHLNHKNVEYFTNRELIEQKQRHRERELLKEKELEEHGHTTEEDEDDERMRSMKEKVDRGSRSSGKKHRDVNFKNAFSKREERLKQEDQERDTMRRDRAEEEEASPEEGEEQDEEEIDEEEEARIREDHKQRMIEEELESLKEENRRIRNELHDMKHTQEIERRYGEPQVHAADTFPYDDYQKSGKLKKTTVLRGSKKLNSDKALGSMKYEDKIRETINVARNNVHEKMKTNNRTQGSKSLNKKKLMSDFEKEPQFLGLRNELYQKYYGHPTHLKEATILLNKGMPTSYMSDSRREVDTKDPKKTIPKRYEKTLRR